MICVFLSVRLGFDNGPVLLDAVMIGTASNRVVPVFRSMAIYFVQFIAFAARFAIIFTRRQKNIQKSELILKMVNSDQAVETWKIA